MPFKDRAERIAVDGTTSLRQHDRYEVEVRIRNVSSSGFMAECHEPVRIGSFVALNVPGVGPVHAQVRWQLGPRMGGQFTDPLSLTQCEWTATRVAEGGQA